ncbi:hypothetical protein BDR06DRAFT_993190 [Suillus hirtellus]|nr:hypothetical protein BDR06DRAFT_993190 [Suillus hirtellus]
MHDVLARRRSSGNKVDLIYSVCWMTMSTRWLMEHDVPFSHSISADAVMLHDLQSVSQSSSPGAGYQSFLDDLPDRTQECFCITPPPSSTMNIAFPYTPVPIIHHPDPASSTEFEIVSLADQAMKISSSASVPQQLSMFRMLKECISKRKQMEIIPLKPGKPAACPPDSNATAHSNGTAQAQSPQAQAAVSASAALPVVNTTILI